MEKAKTPDRLYCSSKFRTLMKGIDDRNFMGLSNNKIDRNDLFLFAMSLGVESNTRTPLVNPDGIALKTSISAKTHAAMYAIFINSLKDPEKEVETISDISAVYKTAEQYANTGFEILADYVENIEPDNLVWDMIEELDEQYDAIQKEL